MITLNVAAGIKPGVTETGMLYQDAGDGYGYREKEWSEFIAIHKTGSIVFKQNGSFTGQRITKIVAHGIAVRPSAIKADGKAVEFQFNPDQKRLEVAINGNEQEIALIR